MPAWTWLHGQDTQIVLHQNEDLFLQPRLHVDIDQHPVGLFRAIARIARAGKLIAKRLGLLCRGDERQTPLPLDGQMGARASASPTEAAGNTRAVWFIRYPFASKLTSCPSSMAMPILMRSG